MRYLLAICLLFSVFCNGTASKPLALSSANVYVCISNTAYAYHNNKECRGLRSCTHRIETMTEETAKAKYKRKRCGYCY